MTAWKNAEEIQTNVREERVLKASTRKRKRESTPGGELVLDDEEKWRGLGAGEVGGKGS